MARGVAVGAQTTEHVPAVLTAPNWFNWATRCTITDQINYEVPNVLTYIIWMEKQAIPLTKMVQWTVEFLVDTWQWGWFLKSFDGSPTGSGPWVFAPGKNVGRLLTIVKVNKNLTKYRRCIDGICTELRLGYNVTGLMTGTATGLALIEDPVVTPPTPSYVTLTDKGPIRNFWGVYSIDGAPKGVQSAEFNLTQNVDPYYESPLVAPSGGTVAGVAPIDWEVESMSMRYNITTKLVYDGTEFLDDYLHDQSLLVNSFTAHDPDTPAHGVVITIPEMKTTSDGEDDSQAVVKEQPQGTVLFNPGIVSGATFSLNGDGAFTNS
jgi:hypothetical protein